MPLLLHIDTAVANGSIALSDDDRVLATAASEGVRDTASWIQVAIRNLMAEAGVELKALDAVTVSAGPGSYTGLRVGMASAKGLCYALKKPLITLPTLLIMASAARPLSEGLLCPMIDARRDEVFTAVYTSSLDERLAATNLILSPESFGPELAEGPISFFGNGAAKWRAMQESPAARFLDVTATAADMVPLALDAFTDRRFADLAYAEPFYVKEFYTPHPPKKG